MCFSAEASFGVGAVLLPAGCYCIRQALRKRPACLPLALIPVVFSIQQLSEGMVWVGLRRNDPILVTAASLSFLFFALSFWPFWVPFCVLVTERRGAVRVGFAVIALLGLTFGGFIYAPLVLDTGQWLQVGVRHHSIQYQIGKLPVFDVLAQPWWHLFYLVLVATPLLASPDRRFAIYYSTVAVAAAISHVLFWYAYISVWCFFAAILSSQLCYIFYRMEKQQPDVPRSGAVLRLASD